MVIDLVLVWGSKMTWFLDSSRISIGFGMVIEIELFFVWGSELTRFFYGDRR